MGLFKKEICPVCGKSVKGITNIKIRDKQTLCSDCSSQIDMDFSLLPFQTVENIKEHLAYREENLKLYKNFSVTREIKCGSAYLREDEKMQKWYIAYYKNPKNPPLFDYDEIVDYELIENGEQVVKGGIGSAVAGGMMFGEVGAIVGSNVGKKKSRTVVNSMKLNISLKNKYMPHLYANFFPHNMELKVGSPTYNSYKMEANNVISFLDSLCRKANATSATSVQTAPVSSADEILKFKNLLDAGVITQEEFEAKKKELLGL